MRIALLLPLLLLTACQRGVVLTGSGIRDNTAENARAHIETRITRDLDEATRGASRTEVVIAELPTWSDGARPGRDQGWFWDRATVEVQLVHGATAPVITDAQVRAIIDHRLRPSVRKGGRDLLTRIVRRQDALRFAELDAERGAAPAPDPSTRPAPATSAPSAPAPAAAARPSTAPAGRRYVVQPGDTLAEISQAFYGTNRHWRLIAQANGITDALQAGQELVIPPAP